MLEAELTSVTVLNIYSEVSPHENYPTVLLQLISNVTIPMNNIMKCSGQLENSYFILISLFVC